ncbi:MAG: hypothetical protein ACOC2H_10910 [Spirochaetota bacterium]
MRTKLLIIAVPVLLALFGTAAFTVYDTYVYAVSFTGSYSGCTPTVRGRIAPSAVTASLLYGCQESSAPFICSFLSHSGKKDYPRLVTHSLFLLRYGGDSWYGNRVRPIAASWLLHMESDTSDDVMCRLMNEMQFGEYRGFQRASLVFYGEYVSELTLDQTVRLAALLLYPDKTPYSRNVDYLSCCMDILGSLRDDGLISGQDYELTAEHFR